MRHGIDTTIRGVYIAHSYMPSLAECGTRIRHARLLAGLTVRQVAEQVQRSPITVFRWEWGERLPPSDRLGPLAEALGVPTAWLLCGMHGLPIGVRETCKRLERQGRAL